MAAPAARVERYYLFIYLGKNRYRIRQPYIHKLRIVELRIIITDGRGQVVQERDEEMKASMIKQVLAVGLAGALCTVSAAGAIAKVHKVHKTDNYTVASAPAEAVAAPAKICWRYYGGPKGGMSPGPCP